MQGIHRGQVSSMNKYLVDMDDCNQYLVFVHLSISCKKEHLDTKGHFSIT